MSRLKAQTAGVRPPPAPVAMAWPALNLPAPDPRLGMTGEHLAALHAWYAGLQGAVNARLAALANKVEHLNAQVAGLTPDPPPSGG